MNMKYVYKLKKTHKYYFMLGTSLITEKRTLKLV